jgi:hypothetical protein
MATAVVSIVGLIIYAVLNSGYILYAKNISMNVSHQQARTALLQMQQDLHSAVSLPQLVDTTGTAYANNFLGPAPGISYQLYASNIGQCKINADAATNQKVIQVKLNTALPLPVVGERLIVPAYQIEDDITAVSQVSAGVVNVTLANKLTTPLEVNVSGTSYNVVCFFTDRASYIVSNGQLQYIGPSNRKNFAVLGSNITSPTPFTTPNTPAGAPYYRFVVAINLSTADSTYSNRAFRAANIFLNGQVPMRARLTTYQ